MKRRTFRKLRTDPRPENQHNVYVVLLAPAAAIVVIDSVAALVPRSELEGDMGDATMGVQARLMSQALRKLSGAINQTKTSVIFTNQLRQKIGVMFGNPETTTGGQALKFYASVRLDVRRIHGDPSTENGTTPHGWAGATCGRRSCPAL